MTERCPTCGSDDPEVHKLSNIGRPYPADMLCPDPYHDLYENPVKSRKPESDKGCTCGEPQTPGVVHRTKGPCYYRESGVDFESVHGDKGSERRWRGLIMECEECGHATRLTNVVEARALQAVEEERDEARRMMQDRAAKLGKAWTKLEAVREYCEDKVARTSGSHLFTANPNYILSLLSDEREEEK